MTSIFGTDPSFLAPSNREPPVVCKIRPNSVLGKLVENPQCRPFLESIQHLPDIMKRLNHPQTSGTFFIPYQMPSCVSNHHQFVDRHTCPVIYEPNFFQSKKALIRAKEFAFTILVENTTLNNRATIQSYQVVGKEGTVRTSASAIIYYIDEPLC